MSGGDDFHNRRGTRKRRFHRQSSSAELFPEIAPTSVGCCLWVVHRSSPGTVGVQILLPIPMRIERLIGVGATTARNSRASTPLERKRFEEFDAVAPAKLEGPCMRRSRIRISPEQKAVAAWPDAKHDLIRAIFAEEVRIAVASEASRSAAEREKAAGFAILVRHFEVADRGLLVGKSHVLGPIFWGERHRHARLDRSINKVLVEALGVKV